MKTINVKDATWETLTLLKVKRKSASMDELLKDLLNSQPDVHPQGGVIFEDKTKEEKQ